MDPSWNLDLTSKPLTLVFPPVHQTCSLHNERCASAFLNFRGDGGRLESWTQFTGAINHWLLHDPWKHDESSHTCLATFCTTFNKKNHVVLAGGFKPLFFNSLVLTNYWLIESICFIGGGLITKECCYSYVTIIYQNVDEPPLALLNNKSFTFITVITVSI